MKKLVIAVLTLIDLKNFGGINEQLSKAYSNRIYVLGQIELPESESKGILNLYYDGTSKPFKLDEGGHFTMMVQNSDKLNLLMIHPDDLQLIVNEKDQSKIDGLLAGTNHRFYKLKRQESEEEKARWSLENKNLKSQDDKFIIPPNTLIVPIYSPELKVKLSNLEWKRSFNTANLPTIKIDGSSSTINSLLRKACWLHLKMSQFHAEQKGKVHKTDNGQICFNNNCS